MKTLFILFVIIFTSNAASQNSYQTDRLYLKFQSNISFNVTYDDVGENVIALTGIEDIDQISYKYNCSEITKLFEGEDETLKLWFIFYLDTEVILEASEEYLSLVDYISNVDLVGICEIGLEPNDPLFNNIDHKAFYDSKIPEAWDIETGNSNIIVGIIDVGLEWNHPDISIDNIWQNLGEDANNNGFTIYQDANGNILLMESTMMGMVKLMTWLDLIFCKIIITYTQIWQTINMG